MEEGWEEEETTEPNQIEAAAMGEGGVCGEEQEEQQPNIGADPRKITRKTIPGQEHFYFYTNSSTPSPASTLSWETCKRNASENYTKNRNNRKIWNV